MIINNIYNINKSGDELGGTFKTNWDAEIWDDYYLLVYLKAWLSISCDFVEGFSISVLTQIWVQKYQLYGSNRCKNTQKLIFFYVFPLFGVLACCTKIASYSVFLKDYRANKTVKPIICRGTAWFIDTTESLKWNNWERFLDATQHVSLHYRVCFSTLQSMSLYITEHAFIYLRSIAL